MNNARRLTVTAALFLMSCGGKSHIDVDMLGDASVSSTPTSTGQGGSTAGAAGTGAGAAGRAGGGAGAGGRAGGGAGAGGFRGVDGGAGAGGRAIGVDAGPPPMAAWWHFDEGAGTTTADATGNGHGGLLVGSPVWTPGIAGSALAFNGSSQAVVVESGPILGPRASFTIEAWINWTGAPGTEVVYCEASLASSPCAIGLYLENGIPTFVTFNNGAVSIAAFQNVSPASWHHLAGVLQPAVGGSIYVDGQLFSSNPAMRPAGVQAVETDIGRFQTANGSGAYFSGKIDEVRIFTMARTAQDVMRDFNGGAASPTALAHSPN